MALLKFKKDKKSKSSRVDKEKLSAKDSKEKTKKPKVTKGVVSFGFDMIPLVTEKGVLLQEKGFAVFRVPRQITKGQIRQAIKARYKVPVLAVKTISMAAKSRKRGRTEGKTAAWKKAYVKVDDIQKLVAGP